MGGSWRRTLFRAQKARDQQPETGFILKTMRPGSNHTVQHRIVFTHGGGRFANQLMLFGHLIAMIEECPELSVCNFSFWPYAKLCAGTERNPLCVYPPTRSKYESVGRLTQAVYAGTPQRFVPPLSRGIAHLMHFLAHRRRINFSEDVADLGDRSVRRMLTEHSWVLLAGWKLRNWAAFERNAQAIRSFLQPAPQFRKPSHEFMAKLRQQHPRVIGLLMRQTDYRGWFGGRYFRTSLEYREIIDALWERFGEDTVILVSSDESQDPHLFSHPNIQWATGTKGSGHFMESFCQLGMCDLVVSVPSTFAAWAAFLGDTPLLCCADGPSAVAAEPMMENALLDARNHTHCGQAMFW